MSYNKEKGLYEGYIYCITNQVNGKQYIGQTMRTVDLRFRCHVSEAKNNYDTFPLHKAMRKYNVELFSVDTLIMLASAIKSDLKQMLNQYEQYYIYTLDTYKPNGYNLTLGGDTCGYCRGKEVVKVGRNGNILKEFESGAEACRQMGISETSLESVLNKRTKKAYDYYWYYKNEINIKDNKVVDWDCKDKYVAQYSISGDLLKVYTFLVDASKSTRIPSSRISECCLGKRQIANGFQFKYFNEVENIPDKIDKYSSVQCQSKIVAQYSCFGVLLNIFVNRIVASESLGITYTCIDRSCRNKNVTKGNYQFRYYDNYNDIKNNIDPCFKYSDWDKVVAQYNLNGNLVKTFDSVISASDSLALSKASIEACCKGRKQSAVGYQFRFYNSLNDVLQSIQKINPRKRPVWQKNINDEKIMYFESASSAERVLNIKHEKISACCRGKMKSAGGFMWEFAKENAS